MHINENPHLYAWKANTCLLQKSHPSYDHEKCSGGATSSSEQEASTLDDRVSKQALAQAMNDAGEESKE